MNKKILSLITLLLLNAPEVKPKSYTNDILASKIIVGTGLLATVGGLIGVHYAKKLKKRRPSSKALPLCTILASVGAVSILGGLGVWYLAEESNSTAREIAEYNEKIAKLNVKIAQAHQIQQEQNTKLELLLIGAEKAESINLLYEKKIEKLGALEEKLATELSQVKNKTAKLSAAKQKLIDAEIARLNDEIERLNKEISSRSAELITNLMASLDAELEESN